MAQQQNSAIKSVKRVANYFTVTMALLYGFYWAAMGIFDYNPSWEDAVGNVILVGIILGAMTMGLAGAIGSIQKSKR